MATNPDYLMATNMAYKVLSEHEVFSLPVSINDIIERYPDIQVYSYAEVSNKFGVSIDVFLESSNHGFTIIKNGDYKILYNNEKDIEIIRFTLAHELGHYILCHTVDDEVSAREANCFARNILCPIPVIKELQMQTVEDYMDIFAVSEPMASISINLAYYDIHNIDQDLYSKMQDLLMCHMTGCTLSELYGYPDSIDRPRRRTSDVWQRKAVSGYATENFAYYVSEEERELLDRLKFGK